MSCSYARAYEHDLSIRRHQQRRRRRRHWRQRQRRRRHHTPVRCCDAFILFWSLPSSCVSSVLLSSFCACQCWYTYSVCVCACVFVLCFGWRVIYVFTREYWLLLKLTLCVARVASRVESRRHRYHCIVGYVCERNIFHDRDSILFTSYVRFVFLRVSSKHLFSVGNMSGCRQHRKWFIFVELISNKTIFTCTLYTLPYLIFT